MKTKSPAAIFGTNSRRGSKGRKNFTMIEGRVKFDPTMIDVCRDQRLRGEAKLTWLRLWIAADCQPGTVHTTALEIAAFLGRSERAARDWVKNLAQANLIKIIDRLNNGQWQLFVMAPTRLKIIPPGEPNLFATDELAERDSKAVAQFVEVVATKSAGVSAPKPPGVSVPKPPRCNHLGEKGFAAIHKRAAGVLVSKPPRPSMETLNTYYNSPLPIEHGNHSHGDPQSLGSCIPAAIEKLGERCFPKSK